MALTKVGKEGITGISNASDATAITIDSSENVGIGTSSPGTALSFDKGTNTIIGLNFNSSSGSGGSLQIRAGGGNGNGNTGGNLNLCSGTGTSSASVGNIIFGRSSADNTTIAPDAEYMRITSGGSLCVGKTSDALDDDSGVVINGAAGLIRLERSNDPCLQINRHSGDGVAVQFFSGASSQVGNITVASSSTAYNTSSDHRLKENVDYSFDATTRLKQLKPARFNFIADADTTVDGFLAHEVQSVVPEAITGTHNEVDDDGNAVMQGIDQSKLVPLLVKTIQELEARITALENG